MRRIDSAKRARIEGAFTSFPKAHRSAIAKLSGTDARLSPRCGYSRVSPTVSASSE